MQYFVVVGWSLKVSCNWTFPAFDILKFLKFKYINSLQWQKVYLKFVKEEALKFDKSIYFNLWQPKNIPCISWTFEVSKLDRLTEINS